MNRREMIKVAAVAALGSQLVGAEPLYFTPAELALLDELTEIIIPVDDHSPGAHAAGVAAYIDRRLAEAIEPDRRELFRQGLKQFPAGSSTDEKIAMLTALEQQKDKFFQELKAATAHAYYTSKIGIHEELEYKGNTLQEVYAGYDPS